MSVDCIVADDNPVGFHINKEFEFEFEFVFVYFDGHVLILESLHEVLLSTNNYRYGNKVKSVRD
jgi:hypothetical protein